RSWSGSHLPPSIVSMKWRSTESSFARATLYPPCTMRVQPHLPRRPFTAMVMESDGFFRCACSAAKRPAPPEPRISMSVLSRLMLKLHRKGRHARGGKEKPHRQVRRERSEADYLS